MTTTKATTRLTSLAPQLLVNDLARAIAYYERIGFRFAEPWDGFYAIGSRDCLEDPDGNVIALAGVPHPADWSRPRAGPLTLCGAAASECADVHSVIIC